jgi:hypothetical protein
VINTVKRAKTQIVLKVVLEEKKHVTPLLLLHSTALEKWKDHNGNLLSVLEIITSKIRLKLHNYLSKHFYHFLAECMINVQYLFLMQVTHSVFCQSYAKICIVNRSKKLFLVSTSKSNKKDHLSSPYSFLFLAKTISAEENRACLFYFS